MFDRLFGRKKEKKVPIPIAGTQKKENPNELRVICSDDPGTYEALYDTMFLNPRSLKVSMEEAARQGNYWIAGGLAIWKGDTEKVKEYFGELAKKTGRTFKILEIPERAVKKAQEYYAKNLKEEKKEQ